MHLFGLEWNNCDSDRVSLAVFRSIFLLIRVSSRFTRIRCRSRNLRHEPHNPDFRRASVCTGETRGSAVTIYGNPDLLHFNCNLTEKLIGAFPALRHQSDIEEGCLCGHPPTQSKS